MQPGRTPSWNVVADLDPTAWLEAVAVASGDRLPLPSALRKRVSWGAPEGSLPLLAKIGDDDGVTVAPLSAAEPELAAVRSALAGLDSDERGGLVLAAMATYARVSLQPDGRLRLSPTLSRHLCAVPGGTVWVSAYGDAIKLWSETAWLKVLAANSAALRDAVSPKS